MQLSQPGSPMKNFMSIVEDKIRTHTYCGLEECSKSIPRADCYAGIARSGVNYCSIEHRRIDEARFRAYMDDKG